MNHKESETGASEGKTPLIKLGTPVLCEIKIVAHGFSLSYACDQTQIYWVDVQIQKEKLTLWKLANLVKM